MLISSLQNARIKQLVKLNNRRQRDAVQLTLVEGEREVERALACGFVPQEAYVCSTLLGEAGQRSCQQLQELAENGELQLIEVTMAVYEKIAYRGQSGGILLTIPYWATQLTQLPQTETPFFVVLDNIEKPGNLGAILRTADAAGVDGVILTGQGTDIFNPNVVRASLGTLFSVPVAVAHPAEVARWLYQHGIQIVATTPAATEKYTDARFCRPTAVLMGSEAHGLNQDWLDYADSQVVIPMHGIADSLNLSTATALLLYEVVRQRQAQ
ncbi:MAG: RNA methyltransferase [Chloroflexota bacterium]